MSFLVEYGLFLAKVITMVIAIIVVVASMVAIASKGKEKVKDKLVVKKLNEKYKTMAKTLQEKILSKGELKDLVKSEKKVEKAEKHADSAKEKHIFVLNFHGDIKASAVKNLREEITAILMVARPQDEVVLCLESPGGMVHGYGLAASQLQRLRQHNIPLTVTIDKVAASGGYMMACVANQILAAPFAIVGSIGVIAQLPNFNRLLRRNDIEFEQFMAGEYKRTVTLFGENTKKGRQKFQEEIEDTHILFKRFIVENRPRVDIDEVATGEHWYGTRALELRLIDGITTTDDYLLNASRNAAIYEVSYTTKKSLMNKFAVAAQQGFDNVLSLVWQRGPKNHMM